MPQARTWAKMAFLYIVFFTRFLLHAAGLPNGASDVACRLLPSRCGGDLGTPVSVAVIRHHFEGRVKQRTFFHFAWFRRVAQVYKIACGEQLEGLVASPLETWPNVAQGCPVPT